MSLTRRGWLRAGLWGLVGWVLVGRCGKAEKKTPNEPSANSTDTMTLDLNDPAYASLREVGGVFKVTPVGWTDSLLVIRTGTDRVTALSMRCPHAGCEVRLPQNNEIVCPCHGSRFSLDGNVLRGPATKPLVAFPAEIRGTVVTIALSS